MENTMSMLPSPSTIFPSFDVVEIWLFYFLTLEYQVFVLFCFFSNLQYTKLIKFKKSFWNFIIIIIIIIIILANLSLFIFQ